jgi:ParB family chromosome partitioning protein
VVTKKTKGLGKGLGTMFGVRNVAEALAPVQLEGQTPKVDIAKLIPGKYQARKTMGQEGIQELADSIRAKGILNPIVVRKLEDGYEILAGERRYRAALEAGLVEVPVTVLNVSDEDALSVGLIENLQREDLNAMETAEGMQRLIEEFQYTHEEVAKSVGCSRSAVSNLLRLLTLSAPVQKMVRDGLLEMGHARALLPLKEDQQIKFAKEAAQKGLSVREVEKLAAGTEAGGAKNSEKGSSEEKNPEIAEYETQLSGILGAKVKLSADAKGKGKIQIVFASMKELHALLEKLKTL